MKSLLVSMLRVTGNSLCQKAADKIEELERELAEGDGWRKQATEALEGGTCPVCFATDEAGHKQGCDWGEDIAKAEDLERRLGAATELLKHSSQRISWGHCFNLSEKGYFLDGEYVGKSMEDVIKKAAEKKEQ